MENPNAPNKQLLRFANLSPCTKSPRRHPGTSPHPARILSPRPNNRCSAFYEVQCKMHSLEEWICVFSQTMVVKRPPLWYQQPFYKYFMGYELLMCPNPITFQSSNISFPMKPSPRSVGRGAIFHSMLYLLLSNLPEMSTKGGHFIIFYTSHTNTKNTIM